MLSGSNGALWRLLTLVAPFYACSRRRLSILWTRARFTRAESSTKEEERQCVGPQHPPEVTPICSPKVGRESPVPGAATAAGRLGLDQEAPDGLRCRSPRRGPPSWPCCPESLRLKPGRRQRRCSTSKCGRPKMLRRNVFLRAARRVRSLLFVTSCVLALAMSEPARGQGFTDDFEAPTIDMSLWSIWQQNGAVQVSTEVSHSALQSAKFASSSGGQRYIQLIHTFASPLKGDFSIWFYDAAPGQETLYEQLQLTNSSQPGLFAGTGTMDFDAYCYMAFLGLPTGQNLGPNATCGFYPQASTTNVMRTLGWHRLNINASPAAISFSIDSTEVFTTTGDFSFDTVTISVSGPFWRPNTVAYFDDFAFVPVMPPSITSLTVAASDGSGTAPMCSITAVTSNEVPTAPGEIDWVITSPLTLALRAERAGSGDSRVYAITVTCTNASNLSASKTVAVGVP